MNNNHTKTSAKTISENDPIVLEILGSRYWEDRYALARLGFHLDKLKDDHDAGVRRVVVKHGVYLNELKDDRSWLVRREVAYQGAFLDELKNDLDEDVRNAALEKLKELEKQRS